MTAVLVGLPGRAGGTLAVLLCLPALLWGLTGNEWNALPPASKTAYVWGVVDAWARLHDLDVGVSMEGRNPTVSRVVTCIRDKQMTQDQIHALVETYLRDHPDKGPYEMVALTWNALDQACKGE